MFTWNLWFYIFVCVFWEVVIRTNMEATAREHIEEIRKTKFSIGGDHNPLIEDLHQAVKNLSAELYAKDVHFLMELIQVSQSLFCVRMCVSMCVYIYIYMFLCLCLWLEEVYPVSGACFLLLISWWVSPAYEREEAYIQNR